MSTQVLYLEGRSRYAMVQPGQEDKKYGNKIKVGVYLTPEATTLFKMSGSRKEVKNDEHGDYVIFDRDLDAEIGKSGHKQGYAKIVEPNPDYPEKDKENKTIPFTKMIGNGSEVVLRIEIYDSKFGKGTRLEGVNVIKHIPYDGGAEVTNPDNLYAF